jgi:hypothetical protein
MEWRSREFAWRRLTHSPYLLLNSSPAVVKKRRAPPINLIISGAETLGAGIGVKRGWRLKAQ